MLVAICGYASVASAQCGDELMKTALAAMGNCQYIKDLDIKVPAGSADGVKFTVVLQSHTFYQFNIANGSTNSEKVTIQVFDKDGKILGTNAMNDKVFEAFQIKCMATGPYKLIVNTNGKSEACARAVLSLVKQFTE